MVAHRRWHVGGRGLPERRGRCTEDVTIQVFLRASLATTLLLPRSDLVTVLPISSMLLHEDTPLYTVLMFQQGCRPVDVL